MKRTRLFIFGFFLLILSPSAWSETLEETTSNPESICSWEAPMNFQASQITPTSITVTWDHPAQGAAPRGYSLKIFETATGVVRDSVKVNGTEKSFTGLQMGTFYTCEIRSVCNDGEVSEHFAINTNPTIILDEIVNSLCNEPPVTSDPVGDLLNSVISNANTVDYVDWVENYNEAQYQFYYFRVSDVNSTTKVAKFIMYREHNETDFHFKNKFGQTWVASLNQSTKMIDLIKNGVTKANVIISGSGFYVLKNSLNGSFSIKVDLSGTCTNYAGLEINPIDEIYSDQSELLKSTPEKKYNSELWIIYPNPSFGTIFLNWNIQDFEISKIEILNQSGMILKSQTNLFFNQFENDTIDIDINDLPPGFYTIALNTNKGILFKKFIKI